MSLSFVEKRERILMYIFNWPKTLTCTNLAPLNLDTFPGTRHQTACATC